MHRSFLALALVVLAACSPSEPDELPRPTPTEVPGLGRVQIRLDRVAMLDQPLAMAPHPESGELYVAEKAGRVRTLDGERVLDISSEVSGGSEQGLLGLAFSPDGAFLYVNFTDRSGDTHVREYRFADGGVGTGSAREVLGVGQPFSNHNGGHLAFGPDGYLYIGLGDGGSGGDPEGNAQSLGTLLGKMLRIDPRPSGGEAYAIPDDNPFVGRQGVRAEIWAFGLRNPWRYSFDRQTGDLWIGDVGQSAIEEVNRQPSSSSGGENYGWDRLEGRRTFEGDPPDEHTPPVYQYERQASNCAVTGGYVYRGSAIPDLVGAYVFGDYCAGEIRALRLNGGDVEHAALGQTVPQLASFAEDAEGELYALSLEGGIYRIDAA